jgi:hypothetical protein
MLVDEDN